MRIDVYDWFGRYFPPIDFRQLPVLNTTQGLKESIRTMPLSQKKSILNETAEPSESGTTRSRKALYDRSGESSTAKRQAERLNVVSSVLKGYQAVFCSVCQFAAFGLGGLLLSGCGAPRQAAIQFTLVPQAGPGGAAKTVRIAGRVTGSTPGQKIVLFARDGTWWVQPFASRPFTPIQPDHSWANVTHVGMEYAALLVAADYTPPKVADVLPARGGPVIAVATVPGAPSSLSQQMTPGKMSFSGFEWEVYRTPKDSFGILHSNSSSNVWTDAKGWLHLRITKESGGWTGAEICLTRSLGYGTYSFQVHELPKLEPATVLIMRSWDPLDAGQYHRAFDIMLGQFGDPSVKNAQYSVFPFNVPANVHHFAEGRGAFTHSIRWEMGRLWFKTQQTGGRSRVIAEHVFTAGIPTAGGERIHISLYAYGNSRVPEENGAEVVIEKFVFLP